MGAAIGVGFDVAQKVWNGEEIKGEELVETAIVSGADFGVKAAAAGALKVAQKKALLKQSPKALLLERLQTLLMLPLKMLKLSVKWQLEN